MSPFACIRRQSSCVEARWSRIGGADEAVVGRPDASAMAWNCAAISSTSAFGVCPCGRRLLDLEAVLIRAGEEKNVKAVDALEARDRIGGDDLVGVADVRSAVRIRNGRCKVEFLFLGHGATLVSS